MITVSQLTMEYESSEAIKEKRSRRIAFFSAVGVYAVLLLIMLLVRFTPPNPPWQEPGGGAEITLGEDLIGMDNTFESVASSNQPAQQQIVITQPQPDVETLVDETDDESAPIEEKKQPEKKQEKPVQQQKVVTQQVTQEKQPTVNKDALFTKKPGSGSDPNGTVSSKGTGYTPGNQGDPNGDLNSHSWEKYGDGTDGKGIGIQGDLRGRGILSLPAPEKNYVEGKVVVEVCIDQEGNVISARGGGKGSTITNPSTVEEAERKARLSKFKPDPNAPSMQCGQIIYNFRPQ